MTEEEYKKYLGNAPAPKESSIVARILKYLNTLPECYAIKQHGGSYSTVGTPDIVGCLAGRMFLFEVKRLGNKPTPIQLHRLHQWEAAGAIVGVVHNVDEVREALSEHLDGR